MPSNITRAVSERRQKLERLKRHQQRREQLFRQTSERSDVCLDAGDLIDWLIDEWPDAPRFASTLVDRLVAGDTDLERALNAMRQEIRA